jgi:hypothetical protein
MDRTSWELDKDMSQSTSREVAPGAGWISEACTLLFMPAVRIMLLLTSRGATKRVMSQEEIGSL